VVLSGFAPELAADPINPSPRWIIKRVAAIPGDPIPRDTVPALRTAPGTRVPTGRLVVLGDNPDHSHDSRHTGYLTTDRLFGVVLRKMG
ncbi:S26 family signal peptidase, partial [Nonomuraea sp. NPDC050536]|uniref:S26 family signal peptidase n=1 Tax=Nonomuraea sp. NPDC050536 TaxID=3364366 RepID=UPI0037C645A9